MLFVLLSIMTLFAMMVAITSSGDQTMPETTSKNTDNTSTSMSKEIIGGIHVPTGLIADQHFELVVNNCTACHASQLITQNRQTAEGWKSIIEWMQEKQNLWDLGKDESKIIDYLAKNYAPENEGRRRNLDLKTDDWYVLE